MAYALNLTLLEGALPTKAPALLLLMVPPLLRGICEQTAVIGTCSSMRGVCSAGRHN